METNKKEAIKKATFICALVLLIIIVGFITIKYEIEGEKNLPFLFTKMGVISTADAIQNEEGKIEVYQVNDILLTFEKNENYNSKELIRRIGIENIEITNMPKIGNVQLYRPSTEENIKYEYSEDLNIGETLNYFGDIKTNIKNLNIANQGGTIEFRSCIKTGKYVEIQPEIESLQENVTNSTTVGTTSDARILKDAQINVEDLQYELNFNIVIELESGTKYKAKVTLNLPNENFGEDKVTAYEYTNLENIVFKRMRF